MPRPGYLKPCNLCNHLLCLSELPLRWLGKALATVLRTYLDSDAPEYSPLEMLQEQGWNMTFFQRTSDSKLYIKCYNACCDSTVTESNLENDPF